MTELKELLEQQGRAIEAMRKANDERLTALEKKGTADPLIQEEVKKANTEVTRLSGELAALATAMKRRPTVDTEGKEIKPELVEHKAAFQAWMRDPQNPDAASKLKAAQAKAIEAKALSVGSDADGGFLVTPDTSGRIVKQVYETSPIREHASVQTIGGEKLEGSYDRDEAGAQWEGETEAGAETTTPQIGKWTIQVHTLKARPKATQQLLEDANVNVETWLADKVARKFARAEANAFVLGNGVNKPRGFLTYPAGTAHKQIQVINSGGAGTLADPDKLIKLIYALKGEYRVNGKFAFSREGIEAIRLIKQDNKYMWAPGSAGEPSTLFGYQVIEMNDLPAFAADSLSGAFADWREAYQIVDRAGVKVLRDPFTAEPFVKFITSIRVGGDVVNFEAIKLLKLAV